MAPGIICLAPAAKIPVVALRPDGKGDITNYASTLLSGSGPEHARRAIADHRRGLVYLCRETGDLYCLDAKTGTEITTGQPTQQSLPGVTRVRGRKIYITSKMRCDRRQSGGRNSIFCGERSWRTNVLLLRPSLIGVIYFRTFDAVFGLIRIALEPPGASRDAAAENAVKPAVYGHRIGLEAIWGACQTTAPYSLRPSS